jgi:hypothetical protein
MNEQDLPPRDEYDENGVNLTVIRENLKLTPEQRLRKADARCREAQELQRFIEAHQPSTFNE